MQHALRYYTSVQPKCNLNTSTTWNEWPDDSAQEETISRPVNHDSGFYIIPIEAWNNDKDLLFQLLKDNFSMLSNQASASTNFGKGRHCIKLPCVLIETTNGSAVDI